ncbi:hypothetical protein NOCA110078 [metagenome]|uniref:Uncharacterized protein n=1 Tax=metagenome TaxID=256318 RepID=A0A2P2C1Y8_9ZZZZ
MRERGVRGSPGPGCRPTSMRIAQGLRGPDTEAAASNSERGSSLAKGRAADLVNAEHRDEVAFLSGPAAAIDKYEDAPHGATTVRPAAGRPHLVCETCQIVRCRTAP